MWRGHIFAINLLLKNNGVGLLPNVNRRCKKPNVVGILADSDISRTIDACSWPQAGDCSFDVRLTSDDNLCGDKVER